MVNIYNKLFAVLYLLLVFPLYFAADSKFSLYYFILSVPTLVFSLLHWKISNNLKGKLREDLFALFSLLSFLIAIFILFGTKRQPSEGEGYFIAFILIPLLFISLIISLIFGLMSVFKKDGPSTTH